MAEHSTPRRNQINKMTPTEVAILSTIRLVENLGADARLTDAVILLQAARESVADFIDGVDQRRYVSSNQLSAPAVVTALTDLECDDLRTKIANLFDDLDRGRISVFRYEREARAVIRAALPAARGVG